MGSRLLIRNGFVVSLDEGLGNLPGADLLVEDGVIAAIGHGLAAADAEVIDASEMIVMPGFVDTHRHTWQSNLRGVLPSCTLGDYLNAVVGTYGPVYRPEDVYAGNLWGALEALNAGITTLVDWSHCNNTPDHADAGIQALREAGIRAVYAYGAPAGGERRRNSVTNHPEDARRVRSRYFASDDDLLTFALALRGPGVCHPDVVVNDWRLARDLDARITVHAGMRVTGLHIEAIEELNRAGLLGADTTYVHLNTSTDAELALIADTGGSASLAPYVEMVMGHGVPPVSRLLAHGITPSLSIDVTTTVPGDMFTQMRTALAHDRIGHFGGDPDVAFAPSLTHHDVLRFATIAGAAACGLEARTGSLTPGKDADIILIRADAINTFPVIDPLGTIVTSADTSNVDTVLVRGEVRKRDGRLTGVDLPALRATVQRSRDHVLAAAGKVPGWLADARPSQEAAASHVARPRALPIINDRSPQRPRLAAWEGPVRHFIDNRAYHRYMIE
jgi:cytosine/adenosine deaminase-related metal-dependent hydrolase